MSMNASLAIADLPDQPLTPTQRKFNQLVRKIELARAELQAWETHAPLFAQAHAHRVRPLQKGVTECQRQVIVKCDAMLGGKGWTKAERATMRELICTLASNLSHSEHIDDVQAEELKALFDRHSDVDFDTDQAQGLTEMKALMETVTGLDLGDEPFESEEALMHRLHERMREQAEQTAAAAPVGRQRKKKGPTAAELKMEQEAKEASKSIREIYRKLASALHPDRAVDDADRKRRTALMQRTNQAYEANDLLGLFALQLEIEQVDAAHLAQATAERARHYNRILTEQLAQLKVEVQTHEGRLCMQFMLEPSVRLNPLKLGTILEREIRYWRHMLTQAQQELQLLDQTAYVKRWLKQQREELQMTQDFPFDMPF